jgi:hypothetical protein
VPSGSAAAVLACCSSLSLWCYCFAAKPTDNAEPKLDAKVEAKPDTKRKPAVEVSPQLAQRVHIFYEQLGREDVRAVEESDQAKQKIPEVETKK